MPYNLRQIIRRQGSTRRKFILFRPITPPPALSAAAGGALASLPKLWETQAIARLVPAYVAGLAERATTDGAPEIQQQLTATEAATYQLVLELGPQMRNWAVLVEQWHRRKFAGQVLTSSGVDLSTLLSPQGDLVETFYESMMALVRNIDDSTRNRVSSVIWRGYQQGTPRAKIAKEISEATNIERARAWRIAVDQTTKLSARLDQARQEEAGFEEYVWHHSRKLHPRETHVQRDGKVFRWDKPPADGPPGTQPFCGCKGRAYLDLED